MTGWPVATVLRGKGRHFAFGALASALVTAAILLAVNPEAIVVRGGTYPMSIDKDGFRYGFTDAAGRATLPCV